MPTKFDFVSPGIQLREIDLSQVTPVQEEDGLLLIGRSIKGPAMKPVKVNSLENFIDVFGNPMDGVKRNDPWRQGNTGAASYAGYAAQAYLASGVGPVKFIRLGGLNKGTGTSGKAGWNVAQTTHANTVTRATYTGSLGLFVAPKNNGTSGVINITGTLGAIFYVNGASLALTGTLQNGTGMATNQPSASAFTRQDSAGLFNAVVNTGTSETVQFNFDQNDPNFIRNVFNTDPTTFALTSPKYFLGETFESQVRNLMSGSSTDGLVAFVAGLGTGDDNINQAWSDFRSELTAAKSGWFIGAQTQQRKLFRLVALDEGEEFQKEYYICVKDIRIPSTTKPDATFTIEIRRYDENGYVEKYSNLTLNVNSANYISKRIGDVSQVWQEGTNGATGKIVTSGVYPNVSSLFRVEVNTAISLSPSDYPFGFLGPKRVSAVAASQALASTKGWIIGSSSIPSGPFNSAHLITGAPNNYTASIEFPTHLLSTTNTYLGTRDYPPTKEFGLRYSLVNGVDYTIGEVGQLRRGIDPHLTATTANSSAGYVFTLDDIMATDTNSASFYYEAGSYTGGAAGGRSVAGKGGSSALINLNVKQFQAPFFGGFDGTNVLLANPFNESRLDVTAGYERHTVEQALEQASDRDLIRYDLIAMPGITNEALNTDLLNQTEARGDALAIVDLNGIYQSGDDTGTGTAADQAIATVIQSINTENIDNSYGATYYPNVRLRDTLTGNGSVLFAPPSVAAIGAIAKSEADSQPWFAPAGFQRGGLNPLGGAKGPQILGTVEHLTKADRDKLYEVNINPIARFPATGDTVVFGQKTLQQSASALDRINVRRLMNYLKKEIGDIADTILFDQNIQATWNRFKTQADSVLSSVKADFGIVEYKLVLDETTTTPDLQDRNILYAKVFVKPARSIEFIAVDFVITQSGIEL